MIDYLQVAGSLSGPSGPHALQLATAERGPGTKYMLTLTQLKHAQSTPTRKWKCAARVLVSADLELVDTVEARIHTWICFNGGILQIAQK